MQTLKSRVFGDNSVNAPNIQDEAGIKGVLFAAEKYKARMMSMLDEKDAAIMPANTQNEVEEMLGLYGDYKIPHIKKERIVYVDQCEGDSLTEVMIAQKAKLSSALGRMGVQKMTPFIYSKEMDIAAKELGLKLDTNSVSSEIVNNKHLSQAQLRERGVSAPPGKLVHTVEEGQRFCEELSRQGYQDVSFKLVRAASGLGVFRIKPAEIPEYMLKFSDEAKEHGILIDGWITKEKMASPNIQYSIGDTTDSDQFISSTDQILEGNVHRGNINAPELLNLPRVKSDVKEIREWTRETGYRGIIGIDFYISTDGMPYYMEINARTNGSTPGALMVDKLTGNTIEKSWGVQNNVSVPKGSSMNDFLLKLEQNKMAYKPDSKNGVLITNSSAINSHGKAMVVVLGQSNEEVKEYLANLHGLYLFK